MTSKRYTLSHAAMRDLEDIYAYGLERWGYRQAERYQDGIFAVLDGLATGSVFTRPLMDLYRKASIGSHFVVYREDKAVIYVTRILHQQMDIERRL